MSSGCNSALPFSHILSVHLTHTFNVFLSAVSPHNLPLPVSSIISSDSTEMRGTFTLSFYTVPTPTNGMLIFQITL
jgi:hypothetical protein